MKRISYFFIFFFMFAPFSYAGGPLVVDDGEAIKWNVSTSSPIVLQVEAGGCTNANGDVILTHDEAMDLLDLAVQAWEDAVPGVIKFTISDSASIPDVNSTNYTDYFSDNTGEAPANDGINPVVFDSDGEIFNDIFGPGADTSTLGFAGPTRYSSDGSRIEEGQAFFNCACAVDDSLFEACKEFDINDPAQVSAVFEACSMDDSVVACTTNPKTCKCNGGQNCFAACVVDQCPCLGAPTSPTGIENVMRHEVGHMLNLGHSDVGEELADSCETDVDGDCDELTIMYPINEDPADMLSLTHDDEVAIKSIYAPSTLEATTFTITGSLEDINGDPLRCAAVTATSNDDEDDGDFTDTVMFVSGTLADAQDVQGDYEMISETLCQSIPDGYTDDVGECLDGCGDFILRGLDPTKTYTIAIHPIDPDFIEGKGVGPCSSPEPDPNCTFEGDEGGQPEGIVDETIFVNVSGNANQTVSLNNGQPIKLARSSGGTTPGEEAQGPSCSFKLP